MEPFEDFQAARRLRWLARLALLWSLLILGRLFSLQIIEHDKYVKLAERQHHREVEIRAPRGAILDRDGRTLAISIPVESVCINPRLAGDPAAAARLLALDLSVDRKALQQRIAEAQKLRRAFLWVKRKATQQECDALRKRGYNWVAFRQESLRYYPNAEMAASLLGMVDVDETGIAGLEKKFDSELQGKPRTFRILADVENRWIESESSAKPPRPGKTIRLTIDARVQFVADQELKQAAEANHCSSGSVVVMDPRSGDVLAMASYPSRNPNQRIRSSSDMKRLVNQAISVPFEPGSVFKVVTMAAALETGAVRPNTILYCGMGSIHLFGRAIHDVHAYGNLSAADILANSSNVGAIQIGLRVGAERLHHYICEFGFGRRTGIPLPLESPGMVWPLPWRKTSIAYVPMGHEVSATTLQLAQACSIIANGGMRVKPRLVVSRQAPDGAPEMEPVEPPVRVLKPENAIALRGMMEGVVLRGTGKLARLAGYSSGGKTGSAQIFDLANRRYTHQYNSSFMGFAPLGDPALVVVVTLNGASKYGGVVAAPVFQKVASAALRVLGVTRDLPDAPPKPVPDGAIGSDVAAADDGVRVPDLQAEQEVPAPAPVLRAGILLGPPIPDFRGKSLRAVMQQAQEAGIVLEVEGSGLARAQDPPPGSVLNSGEKVVVRFAR